jgi:hypothetical protein
MLVYLNNSNENIEHDAFLESPSVGTLKVKRFESQII